MNSGPLPMILLCLTLGLALALASRRAGWFGLAGMVATAALVAIVALPQGLTEAVSAGLALSVIATAALCYFPRGSTDRWLLATGVNAGVWTGAYASVSDQRGALLVALPLALVVMLGGWLVSSGYPIVIKVVASWMIAIASLSIFVSLLPTPGYKADHME